MFSSSPVFLWYNDGIEPHVAGKTMEKRAYGGGKESSVWKNIYC